MNIYSHYCMKPSYVKAEEADQKSWKYNKPFDFGCIDAPAVIPAGSTECVEFLPGCYTNTQTYVVRAK